MCSIAAAIAKSGPKIRNRCTEVAGMYPIAAVIAKSGPEIGNHCSAIVPSIRIARLRSRYRNGAASDSIFLRRKVELPACCFAVVAAKNGPPAAVVAAAKNGPPAAFVAALMNCPPAE